MTSASKVDELCRESRRNSSDLKALCLNDTLNRSPQLSHPGGLTEISCHSPEQNGDSVTRIRAVDYLIASGV